MTDILEGIAAYKRIEVAQRKQIRTLKDLEDAALTVSAPRGFRRQLEGGHAPGKLALIAEIKKASPSKGVIQPDFDAVRIAKAYEAGGAACLSVLTDAKFFQGSFENLAKIRAAGVTCPLLAKEFIVEAYQLYKVRVSGADAVLLG